MSENFQRWENLSIVGSGGFGQVWKVRTDTGLVLAAKYIELSSMKKVDQNEIQHEVAMLRPLNHKNIVRFVTAKEQGTKLVVFTELIDGTDLSKLGRLNDQRAIGFLRQICEGLHYLHNRNPPVLHRDLKGQNIMVTRDRIIKIIDFGLSIKLMVASGMQATDVLMTCTDVCGTLPFLAPELFSNQQFSVKSDVWALGITVYQMMAGGVPFEEPNTKAMIDKITGSGAPPLPGGCSEELMDFYKRCTAYNPATRPPIRSLLEHAIFRS